MQRLLFICSQNRLRSPTAEQVFSNRPGIEVVSAGLDSSCHAPITPELLEWASLIFVMEQSHRRKLSRKFRSSLKNQRIIVLGIADEYELMDPELIAILERKVTPHLR